MKYKGKDVTLKPLEEAWVFAHATIQSKYYFVARFLNSKYPELTTLTIPQELYHLTRTGGENDYSHDKAGPRCLSYILTINDSMRNPPNS